MKILKYILLGIAGIIVLVLIIAAFAPKSYTVKREVTINKPNLDIYNYVRMHKNQVEWNAWYKMDPTSKTAILGTDGELGATWAWESEKTGKGEQRIVLLEPGSKIGYELHFIKPMEGLAANDMTFEALDSNQTLVKNTFSSSTPYPMNIMCLVMDMDKMIGTEMQKGLDDIKANLEK